MPNFFIILFKINIVLVLFAAAYYLVLRRLTFYYINRIFLLFGILFSTAYPFINLTAFFDQHKGIPTFVPKINQNISQLIQQDIISVFWSGLTFLFYAGVLFMAARLIIQFISLRRMHKNSNPGLVSDHNVRILNDEVSPFSFWQTIYINPLLHKQQDLNNILEHEKVHVEEWHTVDIILAEICLVFYWFNPGVWLMKKAVRENIEFITDAKILSKGINKKDYQYSLLDVGALRPSVAIVNNFNLSDLKKRIKMMNAKRSSPLNLSMYLLVLPILLITTLAFTIKKKDVQKGLEPLKIIVNRVLPNDKPVLEISPASGKRYGRKQKQQFKSKDNHDTIRAITLIMHQNIKENDSTHKVLDVFLTSQVANVPNEEFFKEMKDKVSMNTFTFKDSTTAGEKPRVKNIIIKMRYDAEGKSVQPGNLPAHMYGTGIVTMKKDTLRMDKPLIYYINGKKVPKEKITALNVEQISSVKLNKAGAMEITIKQK